MQAAGQHPNPDLVFESTKDTPHQMLSLDIPFEPWKRSRAHRPRARAADARGRGGRGRAAGAAPERADGLLRPRSRRRRRPRSRQSMHEVAARVREVAQARFDEGAAPRLDVMQADLGLARAKAELELARSARRSAQAELNALLNRPAAQPLAVAGDMAEGAPLPSVDQAAARRRGRQRRAARRRARGRDRGPPAGPAEGRAHPDARLLARRGLQRPRRVRRRLPRRPQPGRAALRPQPGPDRGLARPRRSGAPPARRAAPGGGGEGLRGARARRGAAGAGREPTATRSCPRPRTIESLAEEGYRLGRSPVLAVLDAQRSAAGRRRASTWRPCCRFNRRSPTWRMCLVDRSSRTAFAPRGSPPRWSAALAAPACTRSASDEEIASPEVPTIAAETGTVARRDLVEPLARARRRRRAAEPGREARRAGARAGWWR